MPGAGDSRFRGTNMSRQAIKQAASMGHRGAEPPWSLTHTHPVSVSTTIG